MKVTVIGLGAMGGGMAHSLLKSSAVDEVSGYDLSSDIVTSFYNDAKAVGKATPTLPSELTLDNFVNETTNVVLIVLVNEAQCTSVCFGGNNNVNLLSLLSEGSCVIVSSTVSAAFCRITAAKFASNKIQFCDCPISGGAVRANNGEITIMASGDQKALEYVDPLLQAMGKKEDIHIIKGGVGMGSTVKMVHQLLAGVHIVVAAEALALAAKAGNAKRSSSGLDVNQMYDIVKGAAGNSWMFSDRGRRMIDTPDKVMSALNIFIKDMDIVYSESKRLNCPTPLASTALQQFISGASLGLGKEDDSSVVKVYETLAGVSVSSQASTMVAKEGDNVGELWVLPDGTSEEILEVGDEERHHLVLSNEYTRVLKVKFPPGDTTFAHRHAEDSLYFFLVEGGVDIVNHVKGSDPMCDCCDFGEVRYGTHKSDKPLVHKITNKNKKELYCIDAEVLRSPPITSPLPLMAEHHTMIKERDRCRVYKLLLQPRETVTVSYPFFYLSIVLKGSRIKTTIGGMSPHSITYEKSTVLGDEAWCSPTLDVTITNVGNSTFEQFIAEWR